MANIQKPKDPTLIMTAERFKKFFPNSTPLYMDNMFKKILKNNKEEQQNEQETK